MSARKRNRRSLTVLEAWFRNASREHGLTLTAKQCERIADEIREELISYAPPAEDYPFPRTPAA